MEIAHGRVRRGTEPVTYRLAQFLARGFVRRPEGWHAVAR